MGILEDLGIRILWFDSMGAKSASIYIESGCGGIVIDPGVAAMQPSYPLPAEEKVRLRNKALKVIEEHCWRARAIIITHYHYDHHVGPWDKAIMDASRMFLGGKLLILKNPNKYINESQWGRSRIFIEELCKLGGINFDDYLIEPQETTFKDPTEELEIALSKDFGDYNARRRELLSKGRRWFRNLVERLWSRKKWIKDNIVFGDGTRITWGDSRVFEFGDTIIKIYEPWFHGIEYDRTGWVTPILITKGNARIFYTSDLMGPQIEDYAYRIIDARPDIIIADGPPTYLYPYMLNRINLRRAIDNMIEIIRGCTPKLIIYDHHLLRERKWRERVSEVFAEAMREGVEIMTAAEYLGNKPLIDTL